MASISSYVRRHHVALLALFVALGGTSDAAVSLPRGSVGKRALLAQDFKAGQIPQGLPGAPGVPGKDGADGKDTSSWLGGGFSYSYLATPQ